MFGINTGNKDINTLNQIVRDSLKGIPASEPQFHNYKQQEIYNLFQKNVKLQVKNNKLLLELMQGISGLSNLEVKIIYISNQLAEIAAKLADSNLANMSVVEQTSAGVTEIGEVVERSADIMQEVMGKSEDLLRISQENQRNVNEITEVKQIVSQNSSEMGQKISALKQTADDVDQIVRGVQAIAEQTNLLALNASIEAARAGEQGRGFAVVAEEIRKLAESTQEKLKEMQSFTTTIRNASDEGIVSVEQTISSIRKMEENIESIQQTVGTNVEHARFTLDNIRSLSDLIGNLNQATQEITHAVNTVAGETEAISGQSLLLAEKADEYKAYAKDIEDMDNTISQTVHHLIEVQNKGIMPLSNETFIHIIERALASHASWIKSLEEMVAMGEMRPIQMNGNKCTFGHFYRSLKVEAKEIKADWDAIDDVHMRMHAKAYEVEEALKEKNSKKAADELNKAREISKTILSQLEKILQKVKEMDKNGSKVFVAEAML